MDILTRISNGIVVKRPTPRTPPNNDNNLIQQLINERADSYTIPLQIHMKQFKNKKEHERNQ